MQAISEIWQCSIAQAKESTRLAFLKALRQGNEGATFTRAPFQMVIKVVDADRGDLDQAD